MRVFVEPEADRVFWFHVRVLVAPIHFLIGASESVSQCQFHLPRSDEKLIEAIM